MILLLSVFTGMIFIIVKTLNMLSAGEIGIYKSNVVNHMMGTLGAFVFVMIFARQSSFQLSDLTSVGIYPMLGGILGATFVALSNYTFSRTKVLISTLLILVGQTLTSVLIDYINLGQMVSLNAILGTCLVIVAVIMYSTPDKVKS